MKKIHVLKPLSLLDLSRIMRSVNVLVLVSRAPDYRPALLITDRKILTLQKHLKTVYRKGKKLVGGDRASTLFIK